MYKKFFSRMILQKVFKTLAIFYIIIKKIWDRILMYVLSSLFMSFGRKALFFPTSTIIRGYSNISLGDFSHIGPGATIYTTNSKLIIENDIDIGPNCIFITGNHSLHIIGKLYNDYLLSDKLPSDDAPIIIKDNVWIGAGCIILKGVTIGRGASIGAGSIVTRDIPPYATAVGVPAKVIRFRWSVEGIMKHEQLLYHTAQRISMARLEEMQQLYFPNT